MIYRTDGHTAPRQSSLKQTSSFARCMETSHHLILGAYVHCCHLSQRHCLPISLPFERVFRASVHSVGKQHSRVDELATQFSSATHALNTSSSKSGCSRRVGDEAISRERVERFGGGWHRRCARWRHGRLAARSCCWTDQLAQEGVLITHQHSTVFLAVQ
jgi:hypothetical protein